MKNINSTEIENNCMKDKCKKKEYIEPSIKEIGKVRGMTKGTSNNPGIDSGFPDNTVNS